jgi:hypothetical protein
MHRIASTSLLLGALLLAGACSSADTTSASSTTAPSSTTTAAPVTTKAEFLEAGNAICAAVDAESTALSESYGPEGPDDPAALAAFLRAGADLVNGAIADLRALPQPAGDEAALEAMYADGEALTALVLEFGAAVEAGDMATAERLEPEVDAAQAANNADLTAYGLVECGS